MEIEERTHGDVNILDIKGKMFGEADAERLRKEIESHVKEGSVNIALNLSDMTYIDSTCLGEIVRCHRMLSQSGGKLKLTNLSKTLRTLLTRMRLISLFEE
jgi:anti-sigma B factor antagonist